MIALPRLRDFDPLPDGRAFLVLAGGTLDRVEVVVGRPTRPPAPPPAPRPQVAHRAGATAKRAAAERANHLLESLLDPHQLHDWRGTGRFWVDTRRGAVQLGHLYHLRHRLPRGEERELCVVPRGYSKLPPADIWANLLLMLTHQPDRFFEVANLVASAT